jgi:hypothetical protein
MEVPLAFTSSLDKVLEFVYGLQPYFDPTVVLGE